MNLQQFSPSKIVQHLDEIRTYRGRVHELFSRYPSHVKIDLTELCNHRCKFCFYNEENRDVGIARENIAKGRASIPIDTLVRTFSELEQGGTRAITLIGGGEPLLHPQIRTVLRTLGQTGMQFGVVTNGGRPMDEQFYELLLRATWIRFSVDTIDPETYLALHRPKNPTRDNLAHTLDNLQSLLARRTTTMIGASFLIYPENYSEIMPFCHMMREMGMDYVEFKPMYLDHEQVHHSREFFLKAKERLLEAQKLTDHRFRVIALLDRMSDNTFVTRDFDRCWVHYFASHIGTDARVYPCCVLAYAASMIYGSLRSQTFQEIWTGPRRLELIHQLTPDKCPRCWSDTANSIIEHALFDVPHADFIQ